VILKKRKLQYEEEITENPMNYDAWFDYVKLIESKKLNRKFSFSILILVCLKISYESNKCYL